MPLAISQLPPLDYRHGWNLSRFCDQIHLHALMFNGSRMLFIALDCSPWGNNSRTLTVSSRSTARMAQQPGLIFVTLCCLLQELLGRRYLIENPVGSDLFLSEQHLARHLRKLPYHVQNVDQCQFGANLEGFFQESNDTAVQHTSSSCCDMQWTAPALALARHRPRRLSRSTVGQVLWRSLRPYPH